MKKAFWLVLAVALVALASCAAQGRGDGMDDSRS